MTIKIKPNTLKNIENICTGISLISAGGFLTGALIDNEQLGLISGTIGVASILGKYYSKNKLNEYNETSITPNTPNTLNTQNLQKYELTNNNLDLDEDTNPNIHNSDYAKNLEHYTKIVKSILEEPKNNK